jgi:hypothetical protein
MESKVSKLLDFEFERHVSMEKRGIFADMIMRFMTNKDLIRDQKLVDLTKKINELLEKERSRVRAVKEDDSLYIGMEFGKKLDKEIF